MYCGFLLFSSFEVKIFISSCENHVICYNRVVFIMIFAADLPADDSDIDLPQGIRKPFSDDCFSHPATVQGVPGLGVI